MLSRQGRTSQWFNGFSIIKNVPENGNAPDFSIFLVQSDSTKDDRWHLYYALSRPVNHRQVCIQGNGWLRPHLTHLPVDILEGFMAGNTDFICNLMDLQCHATNEQRTNKVTECLAVHCLSMFSASVYLESVLRWLILSDTGHTGHGLLKLAGLHSHTYVLRVLCSMCYC